MNFHSSVSQANFVVFKLSSNQRPLTFNPLAVCRIIFKHFRIGTLKFTLKQRKLRTKFILNLIENLIKTLFLCLRSSTSNIIRVYDYFGWFAWSLNTEHQAAIQQQKHSMSMCAYSTSPRQKFLDQQAHSCFCIFILEAEAKAFSTLYSQLFWC